MSRDPLKNAERNQGPSLYEYAENDPMRYIDPWGLKAYSPAEVQQIIDNATDQILNTPIWNRASLLKKLHGDNGDLDFYGKNNLTNPDTVCVDGKSLNDDQFGNYRAGYDSYTAFGEPGALAVHGVAFGFSATVMPRESMTPLTSHSPI